MLTPQRKSQMDAVLGVKSNVLTPERRAQMDAVLQQPKSVGGFIKNVGTSAVNAVKGLGSSLVNTFNPNPEKNTISQMGRLGQGVLQKLDPTEGNKISNTLVKSLPIVGTQQKLNELQGKDTNYEPMANQVGDFYKQRYGGVENIKNTLYTDPVGAALDVAGVVGGVKGLITKPGVKTLPKVNTGEMTAGEKIITRGLGNPAKQAKLVDRYGYRNVADFIKQNKLYSRDPKKLQELLDSLNDQYQELSIRSHKTVPVKGLLDNIDTQIKNLVASEDVNSTWGQQKLQTLLDQREKVGARFGNPNMVFQGSDDASMQPQLQVPVKDVTLFRRALDKDIPKSAFEGMLDTNKGKTAGLKTSRDAMRDLINSTDPRLKKLGEDIAYANKVMPIFEGAQTRGANRQLLNFTKMGSAGLGGITHGIPGAVAGFFTEQILNNPQVLAGLGYLADTLPAQFLKLTGMTAEAFKAANLGRMATGSTTDQSTKKQTPSLRLPVSPESYSSPKPVVQPYELKNKFRNPLFER